MILKEFIKDKDLDLWLSEFVIRFDTLQNALGQKIETGYEEKLKEILKEELKNIFLAHGYNKILFNDIKYTTNSYEFDAYKNEFKLWLFGKMRKLINVMAVSINAMRKDFNTIEDFKNGIETINRIGYSGFSNIENNLEDGTYNLSKNFTNNKTLENWYKIINKTIHNWFYDLEYDLINNWILGVYTYD